MNLRYATIYELSDIIATNDANEDLKKPENKDKTFEQLHQQYYFKLINKNKNELYETLRKQKQKRLHEKQSSEEQIEAQELESLLKSVDERFCSSQLKLF